ncbi:MAG: energy transducer TonB [Lentimicrobiaceae bacterium]|jgi:TonB family protein|nr:energy transducer TonB [Lentimicrobiaceae bacterium]MDD4599010.1 energy transducer TonB [Lentimicrobiaceae bacterium]MDY0025244.1 energy transducer TonB [Lentimicrobium sp.]
MIKHTKPNPLKIVPVISGLAVILAIILFTAMIQPAGNPLNNAAGISDYSAGYQSTAVVAYPQNPSDTIYNIVDEMPEFPGGDNARFVYLAQNITYPEAARIQKTEGTVYISFVVEKDGSISNAKILRGIGNGCDEEVIRIINNMPTWKPGMKDDKPVRARFNMPVKFVIGEKAKPEEAGPASEKGYPIYTR